MKDEPKIKYAGTVDPCCAEILMMMQLGFILPGEDARFHVSGNGAILISCPFCGDMPTALPVAIEQQLN